MNKRRFLKTSGAVIGSGILSRLLAHDQHDKARRNWSGNYTYSTDQLHVPKTVEEVQSVVKSCDRLRALGARHSFNGIADSRANQVSLKNLAAITLDRESKTVAVGAGVSYGQVSLYLHQNGYALHNLASLPHIWVVGACSTGTHGSGIKNGNLSTVVSSIEFVKANGEIAVLKKTGDAERFRAAVVGLGALGIITKITLEVQPTYNVSQVVYENLPLGHLETHLDEIFSSGYSVSLFTDWQDHRATQVWIKRRVEGITTPKLDPEFFGAKLATRNLHPLAGHSAENCTEQMGIPGPWYERLPHFRMNFTPSSGAELQSEYFVPREKGFAAILAVEKLRDHLTPHLFISELRTIDGDDLWMSQCYKRPSMAIHFTWKPDWPAVKQLLPMIEEQLAPFDARPHWAKLFTMAPPRLQSRYKKLAEFKEMLAEYDPHEKFRNQFLNTNLYGG